ncbi:hypothetical protein BH09ACT6_BH09ACT6_08050 [soil metagenome]
MRVGSWRHRPAIAVASVLAATAVIAAFGGGTAAAELTPAPVPTGFATTSEINAFLTKERADLKLSGLAVVVLSQ